MKWLACRWHDQAPANQAEWFNFFLICWHQVNMQYLLHIYLVLDGLKNSEVQRLLVIYSTAHVDDQVV